MNQSDWNLLRDYASQQSEPAFSELVARHLNLVYSTALRMVGESHCAQDIAQTVFLELVRYAKSLPQGTVISGWLYRKTRYASLNWLRAEGRRRKHEEQAMQMAALNAETETAWQSLEPCLEEAMGHLGKPEQDALLLRFFAGKSLREVGETLGLSDDAAQKRVSRALEKLRSQLARQGVSMPVSLLAPVIASRAVQAAPTGLLAKIAAGAAATATTTGSAAVMFKFMEMLIMAKIKIAAIAVCALVAVATYTVITHDQTTPGNQPVTPSPTIVASMAKPDTTMPQTTRTVAPPVPAIETPQEQNALELTPDQLEKFLSDNKRNADSLLSAYLASGNGAYLKEAAEKYPHDPKVLFKVVTERLFPEEQRSWLERLKQAAPDNALAFYLSAGEFIKNGQSANALQDLMAAHAKAGFNDFSREYIQNLEEIYAASGIPNLLAKGGGMKAVGLNHLGPMKTLARQVLDYRQSYLSAGDTASAGIVADVGLKLGHQLSSGYGGMTLINQLVGIAIESQFLALLDPNAAFPAIGKTVQERQHELALLKQEIKTMAPDAQKIFASENQEDAINYFNRLKITGEYAAMKWFQEKITKP